MIRTISGTVTHHLQDGIVVSVSGVGYLVAVPARSVPRVGEQVELFTFHYIREDLQALYGFGSVAELQMFQALLTVPSIGPKRHRPTSPLPLLLTTSASSPRFPVSAKRVPPTSLSNSKGNSSGEVVQPFPVAVRRLSTR